MGSLDFLGPRGCRHLLNTHSSPHTQVRAQLAQVGTAARVQLLCSCVSTCEVYTRAPVHTRVYKCACKHCCVYVSIPAVCPAYQGIRENESSKDRLVKCRSISCSDSQMVGHDLTV